MITKINRGHLAPGLFFFLQKLIIGNTKGFIRGKALATEDALNDKANADHEHSAVDITSGVLGTARLPTIPVSKGGTGKTSLTYGCFLRGSGTSAVTLSSIDEVKEELDIKNIGISYKSGSYVGNAETSSSSSKTKTITIGTKSLIVYIQ